MNTHTSRGWLFLLLAALAGIAMLFAACGGGADDDGGDDGNDATATATADEGDDDDGDDEEETGEPTEDSGDDGGDDGSDNPFEDLSDLTGDYANARLEIKKIPSVNDIEDEGGSKHDML